MQQGSYPIGTRSINVLTDNATGVVSGATCDIPLNLLARAVQTFLNLDTPIAVAYGGTGAADAANARINLGLGSIATQNSNNLSVSGGAIDGTAIGQTTPSSGAFTTLTATTAIPVASGGTGATSFAAHGVLIGEGTGAIVASATGTSGQPLLSGGAAADPAYGNLGVAAGGTGRTTLTSHGVLVGAGTGAITQLAVGTTGQVLVGSTGADPAFGSSVGALTFTGAITPSSTAGIVGTTAADNANAGSIGEFIISDIPNTSAISLTTGTSTNVTSINLPAGDWDVTGTISFTSAGSTVRNYLIGGISTTSATLPAGEFRASVNTPTSGANTDDAYALPVQRINVSTTTTVYLVTQAGFTTSTCKAYGVLRARRMR